MVKYFSQQYEKSARQIELDLLEDFRGKKSGLVGDSTGYNMRGYTAFGGNPLTPFPEAAATLTGGLFHSLGYNPGKDINMQAFKENYPANFDAYLRGVKKISSGWISYVTYPLSMATGMLLNGAVKETNPGGLVRAVCVPGAITAQANIDFHNGDDPNNAHIGALYGIKLVSAGKTMISMIIDHLRGSLGGAVFRILGPNDLFTWKGKILRRPILGSVSLEEYKKNLQMFIDKFKKGQQRIIISVPLNTQLLLSPITEPEAHYADERKIYPNGYTPTKAAYAVSPLAWLVNNRNQNIHPDNVYNHQEMKEFGKVYQGYREITYRAASKSTKVITVDPNDQLEAFFKKFQAEGEYRIGRCVFRTKEDFLSSDMIHPGPLLYTLIAKWIAEDLKAAGVNVPNTLDLDKMLKEHPKKFHETFCPEKRTAADMENIGAIISAITKTAKTGSPFYSISNLIGLKAAASIFFSTATNFNGSYSYGPGWRLNLAARLKVALPFGYFQLSPDLINIGAYASYLTDETGKEGWELNTYARSEVTLSPISGADTVTGAVGFGTYNLENLFLDESYIIREQLGFNAKIRYCSNPSATNLVRGLCVHAETVVRPFAGTKNDALFTGFLGISYAR